MDPLSVVGLEIRRKVTINRDPTEGRTIGHHR
jgi:hypothetical protein